VRVTERIRRLPPGVIVAMGWVVGLVYAYPGLVTMDSLDQLREGREGFYTDGHPPAMAAMWKLVDLVISGPLGMLVIQTLAFVVGMYWILRRAMTPTRAAIATALLFAFPPILAPMAVIWKDCVMAGFFLLGTALVCEEHRARKLAGLACFFIATSVRYNAPAATLPLIVLLFAWPQLAGWRRYAVAAAAWIAITAVAFAVNIGLTDRKMYIWQSSLAVLDIAGTLANVDDDIPDAELRQTFAGTQILVDHDIHQAIRRQYTLCREYGMDFEPLVARDGHLWDLPIFGTTPAPQEQRDAIARAFWDVVTSHPGAYLAHRWDATREALGMTSNKLGVMVMTSKSQYEPYMNRLGLDKRAWRPQTWLQGRAVWFAKKTPIFRPWIYLVVTLLVFPLAVRARKLDVIALLLSGLALEATLFPLAPTPDYRYSHWLVTCTMIVVVMLTARRSRGEA
jgi:hypothetical protein